MSWSGNQGLIMPVQIERGRACHAGWQVVVRLLANRESCAHRTSMVPENHSATRQTVPSLQRPTNAVLRILIIHRWHIWQPTPNCMIVSLSLQYSITELE